MDAADGTVGSSRVAAGGRAAKGEARPRLRVLFINDTSRNGGPGSTLFFILKFVDPRVIYRATVVPREGIVAARLREVSDEFRLEPNLVENLFEPWSRALQRKDFDAHVVVRAVRAAGNIGRAATGMARMASWVRGGGYQVIFCNGTTANFAGAALGSLLGVPVVWHVFYAELARALVPLHARLASSLAVRSILCVSRSTSRHFERCAPEKVRIVHDSIDTADFSGGPGALRAELGLTPDVVVFGSQGRILRRKGYVEMLRAARLALDALGPHERARCRFVVLGDTPQDTPDDHLAECRALAAELGLESHVRFMGFVADVKPYVRDFDVAVVPSVYEDPLPRALLEAMALGKPVVAFSVGGIPEIIEDGVHGALAGSPPDPSAMAHHFVRYFRAPELRTRHGRAGRERLERDFDARAHASRMQREIERAAGRASSARAG
jgi:glycosyltransferase involved in cell wall biosynthesis